MTLRKTVPTLSVAILLLAVRAARAQETTLPPMPVPVPAGPPAYVGTPMYPAPPPTVYPGPWPQSVAPLPTDPPAPATPFGSGFAPPPPLVPPHAAPVGWLFSPLPGWYLGLEGDVVLPHIRALGVGDTRGTDLDWTFAPRAELGYVFDNGGSVELSYRFLYSGVDFGDPSATPWARLTLSENWLDVSYLSRPLGPCCCGLRLQWEAGLRTAFFRSHIHSVTDPEIDNLTANYWGAGPELGLLLTWQFGDSGLSLFTRVSGAALFGRTRETFEATVFDTFGNPTTGSASQSKFETVGDFRGELGMSWTIGRDPWVRFDFGVRGEVFRWDDLLISEVGPFFRFMF
jgi:hypothetical protein